MAGESAVVVKFLGDISDLQRKTDQVDQTGSKFKSWGKMVGGAIGGAFAVKEVSDFIGAAEEANAVSAGLAQSLGNAGDATGEWARHAEDLASSLQNTTGIDDEVIKGAQTILGTFHGLSDATGQSSGAFDRATKAALDMSKTGFGDANSAATMLGKALEDPEKGLTALGRVGITFTAAQKEQIKALVATGDKAGAMGAILGNVEGQVGGMAEKTVTSGDKMKVAWGETQEALGNALLPALEAVAPVLENIAKFVQQNASAIIPLVAVIGTWVAIQWILNAAMAAFGITSGIAVGWIALIVIGIAALVAGIIYAYNNFSIFRAVVDAVITAAVAAFDWLWSTVQIVFGWIVDHWQLLLIVLTGPIGAAVALIITYWDTFRNAIMAVFDVVATIVSTWVGRISALISNLVQWISIVVSALAAILSGPFNIARDIISTAIDVIKSIVSGISGAISTAMAGLENILAAPFRAAWNIIQGIIDKITGAIDKVKGAISGIGDKLGSIGGAIGGVIGLQHGGIVTRPTLAMIGEHGPEAVVPLGRGGGGSGPFTIQVNVTSSGLGADAPEIQSKVVEALRHYIARNGPIPGLAG